MPVYRDSNEKQLLLAIQAIKSDPTLTLRRAAALYKVAQTTLGTRLAGVQSRVDCSPNSQKMTPREETLIVQHILDLDSRGFPPRLAEIAEMADAILAEGNRKPVGKNWPANFVKRQPELKVKFNRRYDYTRAQCEDPEAIQGWFRLVHNTKAKHGIQEQDIYNFDETGFMMGQISSQPVVTSSERRGRPKKLQQGNREWTTTINCIGSAGWTLPPFIIFSGKYHLAPWYKDASIPRDWVIALSDNGWTTNKLGVEWLKHFDEHTEARTVGSHRLLIIDGHESHLSYEFNKLCKEKRIVTLCMPPHSSHLLQPLDVGIFSPLKVAYGRQACELMKVHINHITKIEFLPCYKAAFSEVFTERNILASFRGAGLVPHDPDTVLSKLDVRLKTPEQPIVEEAPWESKTPKNSAEIVSQSAYLRERIRRRVSSSPVSVLESLNQLSKGAQDMADRLALMAKQIAELQAANEAATRRRSVKRKRVQKQGTLTIDDGDRLATLKDTRAGGGGERVAKQVRVGEAGPSQRCCKTCGKAGHNSRTCKQIDDTMPR